MKLYFSPGACSLSPHIVLREAGLNFDLEQVDLQRKATKSGRDFFEINPKGVVPAIEIDGGKVLTEGPAIVQYIADRAPQSGLAPANGTPERYRVQEWLNYITAELHKTFSPLFKPNTPDSYKEIAKAKLAEQFAYLDRHLAKHQYLLGDKFTIVDAYCFTVVRWSAFQNIDLAAYPSLKAYIDRIAARPNVQEALKAEGLLKSAA